MGCFSVVMMFVSQMIYYLCVAGVVAFAFYSYNQGRSDQAIGGGVGVGVGADNASALGVQPMTLNAEQQQIFQDLIMEDLRTAQLDRGNNARPMNDSNSANSVENSKEDSTSEIKKDAK